MEEVRSWIPIVVAVLALLTTWVVHLRAARRSEIAAVEGKVMVLKGDVDDLKEDMARMDTRFCALNVGIRVCWHSPMPTDGHRAPRRDRFDIP